MQRKTRKPRALLFWVLVLIVLLSGWYSFTPRTQLDRISFVVASDPVAVWSLDTSDYSFDIITFPGSFVVAASHGYGTYPVGSLWKLGFIDKRSGSVFLDSVADMLGIPIDGYIGTSSDTLMEIRDSKRDGRELFSLLRLPRLIIGGYVSNIPVRLFFRFGKALWGAKPDAFHVRDLADAYVTQNVTLPNGDTVRKLDTEALDAVIKGVFEDLTIRKEDMTVAVYNTTAHPSLATQVSRMLTQIGVHVLSVGNDTPELDSCLISGSTAALSSQTARVIRMLFSCHASATEAASRMDLEVRLGKKQSARYYPSSESSSESPSSEDLPESK